MIGTCGILCQSGRSSWTENLIRAWAKNQQTDIESVKIVIESVDPCLSQKHIPPSKFSRFNIILNIFGIDTPSFRGLQKVILMSVTELRFLPTWRHQTSVTKIDITGPDIIVNPNRIPLTEPKEIKSIKTNFLSFWVHIFFRHDKFFNQWQPHWIFLAGNTTEPWWQRTLKLTDTLK